MKIGISIKINVSKIDESRIFEGKKGKYIDLTTFIDTSSEDEYGNHGFISQSVSKEEREKDVRTPILGNVKVFYNDSGAKPKEKSREPGSDDDFNDDLPF